MSLPPATRSRPRPLSPHLTVYRWPVTMTASILHRITGGALYAGMLLVAWWLVAAATSERQFAIIDGLLRSWLGLVVLFGFSLAYMLHLVGGVRHMIWDTGHGLEKHMSSRLSWASFAAAAVLTLAVWAIYFVVASV